MTRTATSHETEPQLVPDIEQRHVVVNRASVYDDNVVLSFNTDGKRDAFGFAPDAAIALAHHLLAAAIVVHSGHVDTREWDERGTGPDRYPPVLRDEQGRPVDVG